MNPEPDRGRGVPAPKAGRREWWGLAALALPCLLYSMDLTVLNLAVPHITADLRPTGAQLLWIVDVYGFLLAGALIAMGAVGDRIGRRRLLMLGALAFGGASVFAAFATSPEMLIAARALLGLAAATLAPSTLSLIRTMFRDDRQRSFAIGIWIASFSAGGAVGPLVGGLLLDHFWWGSVFLVAVPVMAALLAVGPFLLPEYRDPSGARTDFVGAALSVLAVLAAVYGIKHAAAAGIDPSSIAALAAAAVLGAAFVRRQGRIEAPLVDLGLFRSPGFAVSLLVNLLGFFMAFGTLLFLAQHLQLVLGMRPFEAGLWTLPSAAGFVAGSFVAPMLASSRHPADVMALGLVAAAAGFAALAWSASQGTFAALVAGSFLLSIGLAPVFTLATDLVVGAAPAHGAGAAAAVAETSSELGGALGIAVLGTVAIAVYRGRVAEALPAGLAADTLAAAREGVGPALEAAASLAGGHAASLAAAARDAFAAAFATTSLLCVAVSLAAACVALALRRVRAGTAH
ncbi:MAG TPA: MFS transporter [Arenibaculum sp.]|nr:MFS transporter [Arenibaculum sp.]